MIWLILTPSFWFIITILAYIAYAVKNKEFLAFTLTPAFWKSFFLGFFVGFFLGGISALLAGILTNKGNNG